MATSPQDDVNRTVAREDRAEREANGVPAAEDPCANAGAETPNDPLPTIHPSDPVTSGGSSPLQSPPANVPRAPDGLRVATGPGGLYVPGFVITGEIARGGMGVVLTAIEVALNREVAIKMLLPGAVGAERAARRFASEARITARLQHPGIPPIYQVGALPDGRPYLAMKFIRGRTLAAVLTAREQRPSSRSADELDLTALDSPGLLHVFEQICQAVGYAHAQSVIHRDLKPANIMVGNFGEVQVMDWGLAKTGVRSQEPGVRSQETGVRNQESGVGEDTSAAVPRSGVTVVGQAMGTPGYMPPEQARGEWQQVGARADVFALGGILATILTGHPPYTGPTPYVVLKRAAAGDLAECFARLDGSGADRELIQLTKWCLAPDPNDRPSSAAEVAQQIAAYRLSVEARLVVAESERAAAAASVEEARLRATAAGLARQAAEERADEAEWFAEEALAAANGRARRRRGVFVAVVFMLLVLSGVYGNYREQKGRMVNAPPAPAASAPTPRAGNAPPHTAEHERRER
jgi:serine/threonine protein kinase